MKTAKPPSAFEKYIQETIAEGIQYLRSHGWLDETSGAPDLAKIPGLKAAPGVPLSVEVEVAVHRMRWNAPAHEYLGNRTAASIWYELGQYEWRDGRTFPGIAAGIPELGVREAAAVSQLPAAICADRVGNAQRARDLYAWAAGNYLLTEEEIRWFADTHQVHAMWEALPMRAYAFVCLEAWAEGLAAAETAEFWAKKDRSAQTSEAYQVQLQMIPLLLALARYKLEPTEGNRQAAQAKLSLKAVGGRNYSERLICYFYWYNLRAKFGPELLATGEDQELQKRVLE